MPEGIDKNKEYSQDFKNAVDSILNDLKDGKFDWKNWNEFVSMPFDQASDRAAKEFLALGKKTTQNGDKYEKVKAFNDAINENNKDAIRIAWEALQKEWESTSDHSETVPSNSEAISTEDRVKTMLYGPDKTLWGNIDINNSEALRNAIAAQFRLEGKNPPTTPVRVRNKFLQLKPSILPQDNIGHSGEIGYRLSWVDIWVPKNLDKQSDSPELLNIAKQIVPLLGDAQFKYIRRKINSPENAK